MSQSYKIMCLLKEAASLLMTSTLRKAIMKRSSLKNIFNKKGDPMTIEINIKNKEFLRETPSQNKAGLLL